MGDKLLAKTNLVVCLVVAVGFALTAFLGYRANFSAFMIDIEQLTMLASEDIYYQQQAFFERPLSASLTMAGDELLVAALEDEASAPSGGGLTDRLASYLGRYRNDFGFDSVFLVSTATARYYSPAGVDRTLEEGDFENNWYFDFLSGDEDYNLVVDNDQVAGADNRVTVFVNCKVRAADGRVLGVVGVGFLANHLQEMLGQYRDDFNVEASLVEPDGVLAASPDRTGYEEEDFFDDRAYNDEVRGAVLGESAEGEVRSMWAEDGERSVFVVVRDVPELDWRLVVERDSSELVAQIRSRVIEAAVIIVCIIVAILVIITLSIRGFRKRIVDLTRTLDLERRTMLERATSELFDDIYDLDITHDRPFDEKTARYFESMGSRPGVPFSESLRAVAERQIKEEYRQDYVDTFTPERVLAAFAEGIDTLRCELEISNGAGGWYWMRITGLIVKSEDDGTVHLLSYRQNIDVEKRQERRLLARVETDEMTGLLSKAATQRRIEELLERMKRDEVKSSYALFMLDIDRFKDANDEHGHRFGDKVIAVFADGLRAQFGGEAVVGRVGGDEFAAFVRAPSELWPERKAEVVVHSFDRTITDGNTSWKMTSSVGVAVAPRDGSDFETLFRRADEALYEAKRRGRNGFHVYGE